jgi:hypothetical protein
MATVIVVFTTDGSFLLWAKRLNAKDIHEEMFAV